MKYKWAKKSRGNLGEEDHHIASKNIRTYGEENLSFFPYNIENENMYSIHDIAWGIN